MRKPFASIALLAFLASSATADVTYEEQTTMSGMMQMFGMFRKMAPVGPTLPYDVAFASPFWTYKAIPANRWPNVTMPVLCVGGGKSDRWMQNAQKAIADNLPNARHETLVGQNHMVSPAAIAPMIREFFAS